MGRPRLDSIDIATPERLLVAAEQEFSSSGLERATLADIAARAGISRPALLYHFDTKLALYDAVVGRALSSLAEMMASAITQRGVFRERLRAVVEAFLGFVTVHPHLARIVVREMMGTGPGRDLIVSLGAPIIDEVVLFLEREVSGVPVRAALLQIVSDVFMRTAAADDVRELFWGRGDHTWTLAQALFLERKTA